MPDILSSSYELLVIRTDFSAPQAWAAVRATIGSMVDNEWILEDDEGEFVAPVQYLDDPAYEGATAEEILALLPEEYDPAFFVVVDEVAVRLPEMPLLLVDLRVERGRQMRVIATELYSIEANLSIGNMDFAEFADAMDEEGIFRGF
ncbi:hypothetical protein AB0B45_51340 [Nonomuraea sp. NPDC049152]|uniref:DUF6924 domain-containing protein n=1 Tax=unclassified Nonomuraea TaxID=2593643 RepID=UPI00273C77A1|nr:hypothetical protein [Nonomuraea sp. G32]MDP4510929.1 hypothetical protein [Nonomuraea sp. G32]